MGQSLSARPSLKRKREPESEDQNEARKALVVEDPNKDVQSNSSSQSGWDHDVFLSFRGEDTRKNFTDHLYNDLERVGIRTFRDDEGLRRGKTISTELLNAIRGSRISVVVFSQGYASSRWCLDELVEIVDCRNTIGQTLLPIFYHMDPSDIRHQTGTFAEAFAKHEKKFHTDMTRVQRWRGALTEAANCSGWDLKSVANGYESTFIKEIVDQVLSEVNPTRLDVAKHSIGIESRVHHIKDLLNLGTSNDVRIVGIYGMGGIGKTTLAKAVHNEICVHFEGSSFLSNVKERSENPDALVKLQEQLLYDILKTNLKIYNVDRGIILIKERLHCKRVLVILDDVDDSEKLRTLVEKEWFGLGSRIILTTRNEHLLRQLEVDEKYKVEELNRWESARLFYWHAFKMANPKEDYLELSIEAVDYTGGLPLALVVLGSFLKGRSITEWKSKLEKLQRTPDEKIQKILGISFDSLDRDTKEIFLDIVCFFVGMNKEYATKIFDDCNFSGEIGIHILIERSLVATDCQNKLMMHNLIRDMGREIVFQGSPKYPGKRTRLWFHEDVLNVLHKHTGSETVEGLMLNLPEHLKTKAFTKMENLRLLQINSVHLTGSYDHLSKELKWLCWHKCSLKFLPQNFHLENLVILDMEHSNVEQVWEKNKIFNKLKVLNLSNSKSLTRSPNFSQVPQLEILILEGCTNLKNLPYFLQTPHLKSLNLEGCTSLVEIHESIGLQKGLVLLNLRGCENLRNLPSSISNLQSLKTLVLSKCFNLAKLPKQLGNMSALTELYMESTAIKQLPSTFRLLTNLETLSFRGCECLIKSTEFLQTSRLQRLILEGCTRLVEIHESIGFLERLVLLNLQNCEKLRSLPSNISNLKSLETLYLSKCYNLKELPEQLGNMTALKSLNASLTAIKQLPSSFSLLENLKYSYFDGCECLIESPQFSQTSCLEKVSFGKCTSLVKIHESIGHLKRLTVKGCNKLRNLPSNIFNLESLMELELFDCSKLDKLPEQWENMKALRKLTAEGIDIKQLPSSLGLLSNLKVLKLPGCGGPISPKSSNHGNLFSISKLCSLVELDLSDHNLSEDEFPIGFECLSLLKRLNLSRNNFRYLPNWISRLPILESLQLNECTTLQSISLPSLPTLESVQLNECTTLQSISLPRILISLRANGCTSLERISILTNESSRSSYLDHYKRRRQNLESSFDLKNCHKLVEIQSLESLRHVERFVFMGSCNNLSSDFRKSVLQMKCKTDGVFTVLLPGSEIPSWISHQTIGSSISFRVPDGKIGKVLLCIVYAVNKEAPRDILSEWAMFKWRLCNKSCRDQSNNWYELDKVEVPDFHTFEDHILARVRTELRAVSWARGRLDILQMKSGDEIEVTIDLLILARLRVDGSKMCGIDPQIMEVKRCGIHLLVDEHDQNVTDEEISESED